jgi:16S rRNA (cytidine1402-2'-O)-methyltransferase
MTGWICLVSTPIGNLEDITLRALRMLRECDIILAEDTRVARKLLMHYQIQKPLFSYHKDNEHASTRSWIQEIQNGKKICMISDAGTPGISDPGFLLVRECLQNHIEPEVLPGPSAILPALVKSGLPCHEFEFRGFIPSKKGRKKFLESLSSLSRTLVFFESTHRIQKLAAELKEVLPSAHPVCFAKEISKLHEQFFRGTASEVCEKIANSDPRGEWVVLIGPHTEKKLPHESA